MKLLITGICGFAGRAITDTLLENMGDLEITGIDNFSRAGSEMNRKPLEQKGVKVIVGDIRSIADVNQLPAVDWVIDAAANPSVLAGIDGKSSSREVVENNLYGTVNLLEFCKQHRAGFILLSTSRVYNIETLCGLRMDDSGDAFTPTEQSFPSGISSQGVAENTSTQSPVSLYGATKVASESLAIDYGRSFDFPVWINRCGVLAGAGQFGRADQGIFSFWLHAWNARRPLKYIGFNGSGRQVRDCLHPRDLVPLLTKQFAGNAKAPPIVNLGGGSASNMSLKQLSAWCADRFGAHEVTADLQPRPFDVPWLVMDSGLATQTWDWQPATPMANILEEIATHAEAHPDWLDVVT
ncbi:MAG: NAD-dependent epimerase/dehydratase family protein [Limisphaerales bacterium]